MKVLVTTDTHFGHKALAEKIRARPHDFEDRIARKWKRMVSSDDLVIHLGDLSVGNEKGAIALLKDLPGRKVLVRGNHDKRSAHWYMDRGFDFCCDSFAWNLYGLRILFSHVPATGDHFDLNIHGHLHGDRHRECEVDSRHCLLAIEETAYEPRKLETLVSGWKRKNTECY